MEVVLILVLMSSGIAWWAKEWGRSALVFGIISLVLSPVVGLFALLICGKSLEKKAEDKAYVDRVSKVRNGG